MARYSATIAPITRPRRICARLRSTAVPNFFAITPISCIQAPRRVAASATPSGGGLGVCALYGDRLSVREAAKASGPRDGAQAGARAQARGGGSARAKAPERGLKVPLSDLQGVRARRLVWPAVPRRSAQGGRRQLAEHAAVVLRKLRQVMEAPGAGHVGYGAVGRAGLEVAAHAVQAQRAQVGRGRHAGDILEAVLQRAPAQVEMPAQVR